MAYRTSSHTKLSISQSNDGKQLYRALNHLPDGTCSLVESKRLSWRSSSGFLNWLGLLGGAFTLAKLRLPVSGSPARFPDRFKSLSIVNLSGSQKVSKNAAAAAEKTE